MGVVELVALVVAQPEAPAADLVPPDGEHRAVGDCEERRAEGSKDVVAVMPAARHIAAKRAERVDERRRAVDREYVAAGGELGRNVRRLLQDGRKAVRSDVAGCLSGLARGDRG